MRQDALSVWVRHAAIGSVWRNSDRNRQETDTDVLRRMHWRVVDMKTQWQKPETVLVLEPV